MKRPVALLLLVIMGALWGLQFAMLKLAAEGGYSEINILMLALVLLSIAFSAIMYLRKQSFAVNRGRIAFLLITAVLGYVIPLGAALYAAPHIPAGILTLIGCLAPVVSISIALALRTEFVSLQRVLALVCGLIAIALVLWPQIELPGLGAAPWMLLALLVPACYGIESIYAAVYWPKGWTSLQAVTGETLVATVLVLPIFAALGDPVSMATTWSTAEWAIAVFVMAGVVESLIYFYLIQTTGGVFVSFGTFISLFAGIGWGMVLFGESHGVLVWGAVGTLCAALALACFDRSRAR
ncbi:MAG: DMT family transporter [Rhizobiales bacterium]|nr:DMT family transporter [Hyphomicrobiales bacterium]